VIGRRKAVGRVKKAIATEKSSDPVYNVSMESVATFAGEHSHLFQQAAGSIFKSGYNVPATEQETRIVENFVKKQELAVS
jgi:hypothetical protein